LDKAGLAPRDKAPGIFTPDGSTWYLACFANVDPTGKREAMFDPPIKLGMDMLSAFDLFTRKPEYLDHGRHWRNWWNENSTHWFRAQEIESALTALADWSRDQRDRFAPTTRDYRLFEKTRRHFEATKQALA